MGRKRKEPEMIVTGKKGVTTIEEDFLPDEPVEVDLDEMEAEGIEDDNEPGDDDLNEDIEDIAEAEKIEPPPVGDPPAREDYAQVLKDMKNHHSSLLRRRSSFERGKSDPLVMGTIERWDHCIDEITELKKQMADARKEELEARAAVHALFNPTKMEEEIQKSEAKIRQFETENALFLQPGYKPTPKPTKPEPAPEEGQATERAASEAAGPEGEASDSFFTDEEIESAIVMAINAADGAQAKINRAVKLGSSDHELHVWLGQMFGIPRPRETKIPNSEAKVRFNGGAKAQVEIIKGKHREILRGNSLVGRVRRQFAIPMPTGI